MILCDDRIFLNGSTDTHPLEDDELDELEMRELDDQVERGIKNCSRNQSNDMIGLSQLQKLNAILSGIDEIPQPSLGLFQKKQLQDALTANFVESKRPARTRSTP